MTSFSVLDLAPVTTTGSGPEALRNSLDLAKHCDRLGYLRYWIAEHHNLPSIASSAPDILIGQIAAVTQHMRIGSGGIMLPNHAPLNVAERFKTLEALFPGRIDLGLGRAPGTDQITSVALRRRQNIREDDDFLDRFQELLLLEQNGFPEQHPFSKVRAMPQDVPLPPLYLLGSSGYSAELSASIGVGFAFAHHFAHYDPVDALTAYRKQFRPGALAKPYAILAVAAVCADTDAEADRLATTIDLNFVRRSQGDYVPLASPEEAAAYDYSPMERERIRQNRHRLFVGAPATVRAKLMPLVEATQADEVMITTMVYDHTARKHSYALIAREFGLGEAAQPAVRAASQA